MEGKGNFALGICILILAIRSLISFSQNDLWCYNDQIDWSWVLIRPSDWKLSSNQVLIAEMHYHKLSPTIYDYEQLILIDYNYNQFGINDMS